VLAFVTDLASRNVPADVVSETVIHARQQLWHHPVAVVDHFLPSILAWIAVPPSTIREVA
jgi:hypothetical protein